MTKIIFKVEEDGEYFANSDEMYPQYKLELESECDTLTGHLEAFKMVMLAIGHSEENVRRIQAEGMQERLERYHAEKKLEKLKDELYEKHLEKEAKKKARKK